MKKIAGLVASLALLAFAGSAMADGKVSQATSFDEFKQQFCGSPQDDEHIFILPVSVFTDHKSLECPIGTFVLRSGDPTDDPGHALYNIDPPHGVDDAYDCDAKADIGMTMIGLNCIPAGQETEDHEKT